MPPIPPPALSPRDPVRLLPFAGDEGPENPAFFVAPPTVRQKNRWQVLLAETGRFPQPGEIYRAAKAGLVKLRPLWEPEEFAAAIEQIEAAIDADKAGQELDETLAVEVQSLLDAIKPLHQPLASLYGLRAAYVIGQGVAAFRVCVTGWNVPGAGYAKGPDGLVTNAALDEIPPLMVDAIGNQCIDLMRVGAPAEKNSSSPSMSRPLPATSTAESIPQTASPDGSSPGTS